MTLLPKGYKRPTESSYFKLAQGNNVLRILAEPLLGYIGWTKDGDKRRPVRHETKDEFKPGDVIVDAQNRIRHFWAIPIWDYEGQRVAIWEVTQASIMDGIEALDRHPKWGDARNYDLCVTREGQDKDTTYTVMPEPKTPLEEGPAAMWAKVQQTFNLRALLTGGDPFGGAAEPVQHDERNPPPDDDSDIPFGR